MHVVAVSQAQITQMRVALEQITPSASPNQLARALEQIVAFLDELHAVGAPLSNDRLAWLRTRSALAELPEIHERAQCSAITAEYAASEIAALEQQLYKREEAKGEVAAIHLETMTSIAREYPLLLGITVLTAFTGLAFQLYWLVAFAVVPCCLLLMMGSVAFRSRLLLARLHNGIRAAAMELEEAEALAAERATYETLLERNFESLRESLSKSLSQLAPSHVS